MSRGLAKNGKLRSSQESIARPDPPLEHEILPSIMLNFPSSVFRNNIDILEEFLHYLFPHIFQILKNICFLILLHAYDSGTPKYLQI